MALTVLGRPPGLPQIPLSEVDLNLESLENNGATSASLPQSPRQIRSKWEYKVAKHYTSSLLTWTLSGLVSPFSLFASLSRAELFISVEASDWYWRFCFHLLYLFCFGKQFCFDGSSFSCNDYFFSLSPLISSALPWIIKEENRIMHSLKVDTEKKPTKERQDFQVSVYCSRFRLKGFHFWIIIFLILSDFELNNRTNIHLHSLARQTSPKLSKIKCTHNVT